MKKNRLFFMFAALFISAAVMFSCQKEEVLNADVQLKSEVIALGGHPDCNVDCIDESSGDVYAATDSKTQNWGGPAGMNNGKTLSVKVWNTLTTIEYRFTITGYGTAYQPGKLQYYDEGTADWVDAGDLVTGVPFTVSRPLDPDWEACNEVKEQWRQTGGGSPVELDESVYELIGPCGCEDTFDADLDCSAEVKVLTVTFTAKEAGDYVIQGGLTSDAEIVSSGATAGFAQNLTHPSWTNPSGNPASVTRWEGSLDACETVVVTIEYTGGNGVGSWSAKSMVDGAEVTNGYSIDQDCPEVD